MYYHGSKKDLEFEIILLSNKEDGYTSYEECLSIEEAFEYFKPKNKISRKTAVYLVDDPTLVEKVGGYDDYIYEVEPVGVIEKSDLYWYNAVAKEMGDFFEISELTDEAKKYIKNYWNSIESPEKIIEYRVESAVVKKEVDYKQDNLIEYINSFNSEEKSKSKSTKAQRYKI